MNTDLHQKSVIDNPLAIARETAQNIGNAASDAAHRATDSARDVAQRATEAAKDAAHRATDAAKDMCQNMSVRAEETLVRSKEYVRENPLPIVLGALVAGALIGYLLVMTRRPEPTLRERFVDDPLHIARDALYAALAPVAQRLHDGYDSARYGAGKAMDSLNRCQPTRAVDTLSEQIGRVGNNLKFW